MKRSFGSMSTRLAALGLAAVALSLAAISPSSAQCELESVEEAGCLSFTDNFSRDGAIDVRGRVIAGLRLAGSREIDDTLTIHPTDDLEDVCIRIITSDGLYSAQAHLATRPGDITGDVLRLSYPGSDSEQLREYQGAIKSDVFDYAAMITPGGCDGGDRTTLFLGHWEVAGQGDGKGDGKGDGRKVELLVNGMGAAEVSVTLKSPPDETERLSCERKGEGRRVGFDHICTFTVPNGSQDTNVELVLQDFGMTLASTSFRIHLP